MQPLNISTKTGIASKTHRLDLNHSSLDDKGGIPVLLALLDLLVGNEGSVVSHPTAVLLVEVYIQEITERCISLDDFKVLVLVANLTAISHL